jgi:hypothetical protein
MIALNWVLPRLADAANWVISEVARAVIAAAVLLLGAWLYEWVRVVRAPLTGKWRQDIRRQKGRPKNTTDMVRCKQKGETLKARIKRIESDSPISGDVGKRWQFGGVEREGVVVGHFVGKKKGRFSKGPDNSDSFGTIILLKKSDNPDWYTGFYKRYSRRVVREGSKVEIMEVKLDWYRTKKPASASVLQRLRSLIKGITSKGPGQGSR